MTTVAVDAVKCCRVAGLSSVEIWVSDISQPRE